MEDMTDMQEDVTVSRRDMTGCVWGTWTDRHGEEGGEGADKGPAAELRVVTLSHYVSSASLR